MTADEDVPGMVLFNGTGIVQAAASLAIRDFEGLFDEFTLPLVSPPIDGAEERDFDLLLDDTDGALGGDVNLIGTIDSLFLVPEPGIAHLLIVALLASWIASRPWTRGGSKR